MAKADSDYTKLTADELKECLATGAALADVRSLQSEGHSFSDIKELLDIMSEERRASETRQGNNLATAVAGATAPDRIPEKIRHHRKSVFNPPGEYDKKANPEGIIRPVPVCDTRWNGVTIDGDVDTNEEIELSNQINEAGEFWCSKNDGGTFRVQVALTYGHDRTTIAQKLISYDYKGKSREYPSKAAIAREIISQQKVVSSVS